MVPSNENVTEGTMSTDEKMTIDERGKYLPMMRKRYLRADGKGRDRLLDEMQAVTGPHRGCTPSSLPGLRRITAHNPSS